MSEGIVTRRASDIRPLLLDRFRNAAAAYSLRPLTLSGQDNAVVKVRRSADDAEQDFNPAQINDGTLEQFVNAGDVAPADYGTGAAAAYSLRHVSDGYTGDVVRVRRSFDNTEQDFNPTEIEDGTLTDWVTEFGTAEIVTNGTFDTDISGWSSTNADSLFVHSSGQITGTSDGTNSPQLYQAISVSVGKVYEIQFELVASTSTGARFRVGTTPSGLEIFEQIVGTNAGLRTVLITATAPTIYVSIGYGPTTNGFTQTWDNISVKPASDGHVTTWYDQSGNSNDATQATAASQPKIVSGGSLVTENGKPAIDFDGVDDFVESSSSTLANVFTASFMLCMVSKADNIQSLSTGGQNKRLIHAFNSGDTLQLVINESNLDKVSSDAGDVSATNGTFFKLQQTLFVAEMEQDKIFIDGVDSGTGTSAAGNPNPNGTGTRIGADKAGDSVNGQYDGTIQEIIIYDSDQSSNRELIETNVNHYYSIYSQTNDGFVTTWYDQSGNGNDATQATAASQPKIVSAGSLVVENGKAALDFDGSDDDLTRGRVISTILNVYASMVFTPKVIASDQFALKASDFNSDARFYILSGRFRINDKAAGTYAYTINNTILATLLSSNGDYAAYVNSSDIGYSGTHAVNTATGDMEIGSFRSQSGAFLQGAIQEIIIYASDQSTKRQQIESNINNHYGIY